jgi:hypothetical protein
MAKTTERRGPISYENWKAALQGRPSRGAHEVPLFSDARITAEIREGLGPYSFLNPVPDLRVPHRLVPRVILRAEEHLAEDEIEPIPSLDETDAERYHGGWLKDEIAALASLALGVRFKAGGPTRQFDANADPRGKPILWSMSTDPVLPEGHQGTIIPRARGPHSLENLEPLKTFPNLCPADAFALVRAARRYQEALWIAEAEQNLAWIMFVSAAEAAANHWRPGQESAVERMRASKPELETLLREYGHADLVERVAELVAPYMGSTRKFVDFITEFLPSPPDDRPGEGGRHSWEPEEITKSMRQVYDYRSKALHAGRWFPAPMCWQPMQVPGWEHPSEIQPFPAAGTEGGFWRAEDTRILLHTFEYIVRGALLNWWKSMLKGHPPKSNR